MEKKYNYIIPDYIKKLSIFPICPSCKKKINYYYYKGTLKNKYKEKICLFCKKDKTERLLEEYQLNCRKDNKRLKNKIKQFKNQKIVLEEIKLKIERLTKIKNGTKYIKKKN